MESIETLNKRLAEHYGADANTGQPQFRIVFADDEIEKRLVFELNGIQLLYPVVRDTKKYTYLPNMYVLERLVIVPEVDQKELLGQKLSYEPIWAFRDGDDNPLYPVWPVTQFVVDTLYAALGKKSLRKYVDSELNTTPEGREQRITATQAELFPDETDTGDALHYKEGIVVPNRGDK